MTTEEYRESLEEQEIYELLGEEQMDILRQRQIQRHLDDYLAILEGQSDEELFDEEALEQIRQETIDEMVEAYEEDEDR
jgi:hypothetical protein